MVSAAGRFALVTGAASGIGEALVKRLSSSGAKVMAADINGKALDLLATSTGCETFVLDVGNIESNKKMVDNAVKKFGSIDLVFLNAGIVGMPFEEQLKSPTAQLEELTTERYMATR